MRIEAKTVRVQGAVRRLCEWAGADRLIVHSDQSLVAVAWLALQHTPDGMAASLAPPGKEKPVAANVAVDNAWTVDPKARRVLLARAGEIDLADPSGEVADQRIQVAGLPVGTFGAALDSDGERLLLVVMRAVNFDFADYGLVMVDLADGQLVAEKTIGTTSDLELLWDARLGTWAIGDTSKGALWRWDGAGHAVKLAGPTAGAIHAATFAETSEGVIVSALSSGTAGATVLVTGHAERDRVVWMPPVTLAGTPILLARRHPARALWACLAQQGAAQQIQIRDAAGKVLAEADLRPGIHLNHLLWSAFAPERLWGVGIRALASATIHE